MVGEYERCLKSQSLGMIAVLGKVCRITEHSLCVFKRHLKSITELTQINLTKNKNVTKRLIMNTEPVPKTSM